MNGPQAHKAADLPPEAHRHEVGDGDRERPVDVRLLRQVGDLAAQAMLGRFGDDPTTRREFLAMIGACGSVPHES